MMKKYWFFAFLTVIFSALNIFSQTPTGSPSPQSEKLQAESKADENNSDLVITATVRAKELKFEKVPDTKVEFPGKGKRETVWEADRENLPKPVEPNVTYRDIGIKLRIYSRFSEIQKIVLEAIDEENNSLKENQSAENSKQNPTSGKTEIKSSNTNPGKAEQKEN